MLRISSGNVVKDIVVASLKNQPFSFGICAFALVWNLESPTSESIVDIG